MGGGAGGGGDAGGAGASAYERERAERVARNRARLGSLRLPEMAEALAAGAAKRPRRAPAAQRGVAREARKPAAPAGPPRRSERQRGREAAMAAGIERENRDGSVQLVGGAAAKFAAGLKVEPAPPPPPRPSGPQPFQSLNAEPDSDARFLRTLCPRGQDGDLTLAARRRQRASDGSAGVVPTDRLASGDLGLVEEDVAKVTRQGVTHLEFHPSAGTPVVAAGDKSGHVGLWNFDAAGAEDEDGQASLGEDGVLLTRPHLEYISGLRWARAGARLVSSSYEGTIRSLDVQKGVSEELLNWEGFRCSAFDFAETSGGTCGEALYAAGTNGCLVLVDPREKRSRGEEHVVHDKKINTVSVDPGGSGLLATSSQGEVCVWDVRRLSGKAVRTLAHTRSCQAAYFAPDGSQRVLTTCYDDCLRVFGSKGTQPEVRIRHNNQTGRWLLPFRAAWTPDAAGIIVGSLRREVEIFCSASGDALNRYSSELQTAVSSRHSVHVCTGSIAAATASGRVHIYRAAEK